MSKPGTRTFIGPLTPAQQRRRERARKDYRDAQEIAYARCLPMADAFKILHRERGTYCYHGYATGTYP